MRVAASRIAVLDSITSTREHAGRCVRAFPVTPATLKKIGVAAGAAASVLGVCAGLRKKKKAAEIKAGKSSSTGLIFQVLLQVLGPVLLPVVQRALSKQVHTANDGSSGKPFSL